jgi:tetratricopeptide (TPR) repeat protein
MEIAMHRNKIFMSSLAFLIMLMGSKFSYPNDEDKLWSQEKARKFISEGYSCLNKNEIEKGFDLLQKAIETNPTYSYSYFYRAEAYIYLGEFIKAIEDLNVVIELERSNGEGPHSCAAYTNRGLSYSQIGQHHLAIADYNASIKILGTAVAYSNLGVSYAKIGEYEKAVECYNHAIKINPSEIDYYQNRGIAYHNCKNYKKAIKDYGERIRWGKPNYEAYLARGNAYMSDSQYDKAIADFNKAVELNPSKAICYIDQALAYEKRGKHNDALKYLTKAFNTSLEDTSNLIELSWFLSTHPNENFRDGLKALTLAQKAVDMNPENCFCLDIFAAAYAETGNFEEAISIQEKALSLLKAKENGTKNISEYEKHLNSYMNRKPWRDTFRLDQESQASNGN